MLMNPFARQKSYIILRLANMQGMTSPTHKPVLLREMLQYLYPKGGDLYVDATLGLGGAASIVADSITPNGVLIGLDKDAESLDIAKENLKSKQVHKEFIHSDYRYLKSVLQNIGFPQVDKIFLDLGLSSYQLALHYRGFAFMGTSGPLDMRMDRSQDISAADIVNQWDEEALANAIFQYGEERYSRRIARKIVEMRKVNRIETTEQLVQVIELAVKGTGYRVKNKIHPATRTFQALRIVVNQELDSLERILNDILDCLKPGGRVGIISFHSLEDRLVKTTFRKLAGECVCGRVPELCICIRVPRLKIITKKPVCALDDEIADNPRARSAKFRVAEKINLSV
jgi:16S rRNA (cytosine1402-N4)-methyltransferase